MITTNNTIVAIYGSHSEAEAALQELQRSGFDMKEISVAACDYHNDEQAVGYYNAGHRMQYWGAAGALWGSIWGLLIGSAFFFIPGIGPLLVAGPLVCSILGAFDGALLTGGTSVLGGGLFSLGVPENMVLQYEAEVISGKCMLLAQGSLEQLARAREIVTRTGAQTLYEHSTQHGRMNGVPDGTEKLASPSLPALSTRIGGNEDVGSAICNPTFQSATT